jgi:hypothetical protein
VALDKYSKFCNSGHALKLVLHCLSYIKSIKYSPAVTVIVGEFNVKLSESQEEIFRRDMLAGLVRETLHYSFMFGRQ